MEAFAIRYSDQEVQIADASLVWLAEQSSTETVFTLDRRDFSIFKVRRERTNLPFHILPRHNEDIV